MNERLILMTKRLFVSLALLCSAYGQWEPLPPLPEPNGGGVSGHQNGQIILMGGTNWEGGKKNWLKKIHTFDPSSKVWKSTQELPEPVGYAITVQTREGLTYLGGFNGEKVNPVGAFKHAALAAGGVIGQSVIAVGGTDDPANLAGVSRETWLLDKEGKRLADFPGKPFATAASSVVGDALFVFGGMNFETTTQTVMNTAVAYAFTPEKNQWRSLRPLAHATRGLCAVALDELHIYIAGGYRDDFTAAAVIYDVRADSYREATPLPYAAMVSLVKLGGYVYCIGGEDKKQSRTDKFYRIPVADLLK